MVHAVCMPINYDYKHTIRTWSTYSFSTATILIRNHASMLCLYVHVMFVCTLPVLFYHCSTEDYYSDT